MLPQGIVHPEQLSILAQALQSYCRAARIEPGSPAYEAASRQVIALFERGVSSSEELVRRLQAADHLGALPPETSRFDRPPRQGLDGTSV